MDQKISIQIKSLCASLFNTTGFVSHMLKSKAVFSTAILMYHRVLPDYELKQEVQDGMYVKPETLEVHMQFLRAQFLIVPLCQVTNAAARSSRDTSRKPVCAVTFDDGWKDSYDYAYPILMKYKVPATIFLATDFIGTSEWFWTDRLAYLFFQKSSNANWIRGRQPSRNPLVNDLEKIMGPRKASLERAVAVLKARNNDEIDDVILELSTRWNRDQNPPNRAFLSWEEVREMKRSGLVSYGSHTATHRILTRLSEKEIGEELTNSKERLIAEKVVAEGCIPFCYPNGSYTNSIIKEVREAGYGLAVTTEEGWNNQEANSFCLRRVPIHQDMTSSAAMLGCRMVGII